MNIFIPKLLLWCCPIWIAFLLDLGWYPVWNSIQFCRDGYPAIPWEWIFYERRAVHSLELRCVGLYINSVVRDIRTSYNLIHPSSRQCTCMDTICWATDESYVKEESQQIVKEVQTTDTQLTLQDRRNLLSMFISCQYCWGYHYQTMFMKDLDIMD